MVRGSLGPRVGGSGGEGGAGIGGPHRVEEPERATHRQHKGGREGEERPFGIDINEMAEYAMDKVGRRLGAIESARGADVRVIDRDAAPEELEETFHAEDQAVLAAVV